MLNDASPTERTASSSRDRLSSVTPSQDAVEDDALDRPIHALPIDELKHVSDDGVADVDEDSCLICLGSISDRSVLPACQHSLFCFTCIARWISVHRRCPLCNTSIGSYIIHSIRNDQDYVRHRLPESTSDASSSRSDDEIDALRIQANDILQRQQTLQALRRSRNGTSCSGRGNVHQKEQRQDALLRWEHQLSVRRRVYRQGLYCQHVGSNRASRLVSPPTPSTIAGTPSLQSTLLHFVRRELLAYPSSNLDIDFLATYAISVFKSLDIKSNESIALLSEFLGLHGAQHFCHEVYSFARFITAGAGAYPDKLAGFDAWAHYAWPEERITDRRRREATQCNTALRVGQESTALVDGKDERECNDLNLTPFEAAPRAEVIQRRARLLERLDAERKQQALVHKSEDDRIMNENPEQDPHRKAFLVARERSLREQLVRQRKRERPASDNA